MAPDLLLIVSITTLCMLSPGPDMLLVMRNTLTGDRQTGLLTSLGVLSGNVVHIAYCALGIGVLVAHSVLTYSVLKLAGAAYLIFLGVTGFRNAQPDAVQDGQAPLAVPGARHVLLARGTARFDVLLARGTARFDAGNPYLQGLLNNLLNPKGALFYLGVFTQVIAPGTPPFRAAVLVAAMVATSALFWLVFVATLHLPAVRGLLARSRQTVERAFGVLLVLLGLRVAAQN